MRHRTPPPIEVRNVQRTVRVSTGSLQRFANTASALVWEHKRPRAEIASVPEITVLIVSDRRMAALHQEFCGLAGPTDVLTFRHGEIVISVRRLRDRRKCFAALSLVKFGFICCTDCCISRDSMTLRRASGNRCCNCKGNYSFPCVRSAEVGPARTGRNRWLSIVLLLTPAFRRVPHRKKWTRGVLMACLVEMSRAVETAFFATVLCVVRSKGWC